MADEAAGELMARWRAGDQQAAAELFRRYADRLIALARSRLSEKLSQRVDPEDVLQSAYRSFFAGVRDGRYALERGGDLWQLLVSITLHKLRDQVKHHEAAKRAVDAEQGFGSENSLFGLQPHLLANVPSPAEAVALTDQVERLMLQLQPVQRRMLEMRLQGYNLEEIAAETQRGVSTVRRALDGIKEQLQRWYSSSSET
jgi:RNA polymerase sigma-70 factor (ECF subfamily)